MSACNKEGGQYRDEPHNCICVIPRAQKHVVHQCQCGAGWLEKGKRFG